MGLFSKGKTRTILKFHRTDLLFTDILQGGGWGGGGRPVSKQNTVDSRYLEVERTLWTPSRYPYFDISDVQNSGKYPTNN